jgi:hypothetical protein
MKTKVRFRFFFGDFDVEETKYFVSDEPVGTFLVRFSSLPGCYTLSVVLPEGIMNYRLEVRTYDKHHD